MATTRLQIGDVTIHRVVEREAPLFRRPGSPTPCCRFIAAQRQELVTSVHQFNDVVQVIPAPGHMIDHHSVRLGKPGADAVITGDMIHSPLQPRYPQLGMRAYYDSPQADVSRRELFGDLCDTSTLVCTAHFPSPSPGRITRWGDGLGFASV